MTLVDAHVHMWDPGASSYQWLKGTGLERPMLPPQYARGGGAVTGAVFVQAADATADPVAEARWVDRLEWPELVGIVAGADLTQPPAAIAAQWDDLAETTRVVGVRHLLEDVPDARFPAFAKGLRVLASRGGTFDACIRHHQLPALNSLLHTVPDLTVIVNHLGKPPIDEGIDSPKGRVWARETTELASRPRTFVKLSGLAGQSRDRAAFERHVDAFLAHALDVFGPERAMIASDWPVSTQLGVAEAFPDWVARVHRLVAEPGWAMVSAGTALEAYAPR